jgi:hypothetical protein
MPVDNVMGADGDAAAAKVKRLIVDAERPDMMSLFVQIAIEQYALIVTGDDPDTVARYIEIFNKGNYLTCAKHILLQREADWDEIEKELQREEDEEEEVRAEIRRRRSQDRDGGAGSSSASR